MAFSKELKKAILPFTDIDAHNTNYATPIKKRYLPFTLDLN
jgi:hypothetical protein